MEKKEDRLPAQHFQVQERLTGKLVSGGEVEIPVGSTITPGAQTPGKPQQYWMNGVRGAFTLPAGAEVHLQAGVAAAKH